MLPLNNTFGGRRVQSCVWGGGVTDEYSQAASGGTVVNYIFFFSRLCAFWALSALPLAMMAPAAPLICLAPRCGG